VVNTTGLASPELVNALQHLYASAPMLMLGHLRFPRESPSDHVAECCRSRSQDTGSAFRPLPALASPLPVGYRLPVVSRRRSLLELVALVQPATGLPTSADFPAFAESARLLVADTGSLHAGVHKQIVGAPYTYRTRSFN
jgi:hypothetical protein